MLIEELEKIEEVLPKVSEFVEKISSLKEFEEFCADAAAIKALEEKAEKAKTEEELRAVLKEAIKLLKAYPYPYPKKSEEEEKEEQEEEQKEEDIQEKEEQTEQSSTEAELLSQIETLKKENEELKAQLAALHEQILFEKRVQELSKLNSEVDWTQKKDLVLKMSEEEFQDFKETVTVVKQQYIPEASSENKNIFQRAKIEILGGES